MTAVAGTPAAAVTDPGRPRRRSGREIFRTAGSVALAAAIFGFAVPHFASYRSAWASMGAMTWAQALLVAGLAAGAGHRDGAQVTAAVLLYRAVTYLPPIPLGAIACFTWRPAPALIHAKPMMPGYAQPDRSARGLP